MSQSITSSGTASTFDTSTARWETRKLDFPRPVGFPERYWPSQQLLRATVNEMLTSDSRHAGVCYASASTLAALVRVSERTMRWCLKALCAVGFLARQGTHETYRTRIYRFCVGWLERRKSRRKNAPSKPAKDSAAWSWSSSSSSSSAPSSAAVDMARRSFGVALGQHHKVQSAIEPAAGAWEVAVALAETIATSAAVDLETACSAMWSSYMALDGWDGKLETECHPPAWLAPHVAQVESMAVQRLRKRRERTARPPEASKVSAQEHRRLALTALAAVRGL